MLKFAVPLFLALFCLVSMPVLAETNDDTDLQSESDRLLELEAILLGQLDRGSNDLNESKTDLNEFVEERAPSVPKVKVVPVVPQTVSASDRITEELRKENARLSREIMELNATLSSLRQSLREQEINARQSESSNTTLMVQVTKSPAVLRTSPSKNATRIYSLDAGERLKVALRKGDWYLVYGAGLQAWLPKEDVVEIN